MACYAGVSREEATEKLAQNSLFAAQFIFHCAMEMAKGHRTQRPAILMFFGKNTMLGINKLKKNIA
jgi:hypothetical protein